MRFFATEEFVSEYKSLIKKKSYKDLKSQLIQDFLQEDPSLLATGTHLGTQKPPVYLKRRIGGSSGYRIYYLLFPGKFIIMGFIHPKFGSEESSNITDNGLKIVLSQIFKSYEDDNLFEVKVVEKAVRKKRGKRGGKRRKSKKLVFDPASIDELK